MTLGLGTITGNRAGGAGGGIWNAGDVTNRLALILLNTPDNCAGPAPVFGCIG